MESYWQLMNRIHKLHLAKVTPFMPRKNDRPEPYWVIVAVTVDGEATGQMLGVASKTEPSLRGTPLFAKREAAEREAARSLPPDQYILGFDARDIRWEVRGASQRFVRSLRNGPIYRDQETVLARFEGDELRLWPTPKDQTRWERFTERFRKAA